MGVGFAVTGLLLIYTGRAIKRNVMVVFAVFMSGLSILLHVPPAVAQEGEILPASAVGSVLSVPLESLDGGVVQLSDFRGKVVYIKFWATWCPLCLAGLEDLAALAKTNTPAGDMAVISVVTPGWNGEIGKQEFIEWANAQSLEIPVVFDEQGIVYSAFGIKGVPASIYLNRQGDVAKKSIGDEMNDQILDALQTILNGNADLE